MCLELRKEWYRPYPATRNCGAGYRYKVMLVAKKKNKDGTKPIIGPFKNPQGISWKIGECRYATATGLPEKMSWITHRIHRMGEPHDGYISILKEDLIEECFEDYGFHVFVKLKDAKVMIKDGSGDDDFDAKIFLVRVQDFIASGYFDSEGLEAQSETYARATLIKEVK